MNAFRTLPVRLGAAAAGLLLLFAAFRFFTSDSTGDAGTESFVTDVPAAAETPLPGTPVADALATLDDLGAPDDPLPAALPVTPVATPDEIAETLARQVLGAGADFLPALVAALQASGIGIVGPGNTSVAAPAEPWQGIAMHVWEVRTAAAMVLPSRSVNLTLPDFADVLVAALPPLKGAAVEQLIVDDLRALAVSPVPTRRFFARFVIALGRNATSHAPYDLLGDVDARSIQLNGLQASLILRRLAADIVMAAGGGREKPRASIVDTLGGWLMPAVHAQGQPCALSDRSQTIMDAAAFGSSMAWGGLEVGELGMRGLMDRLGLGNLANAAAFVSTLLGYAQFIATYAALKADVQLDRPPLVRTKKMSPQTGERRELTAVVKLDVGNAQMLNCFRAMLIAIGLDFSLPNNGPVKGARVRWYGVEGFDQAAAALHGGAEAIVQFVAPESSRIQGGGDASTGLNPVTNAVTGDDGKVQIGVEGIGQHQTLSNDATEVSKSAKVRLDVALKGSDLFGDLQEAAGTAAGGLIGLATLPLSVLYRAQWASTGQYRFPVTDWRDGPGEWSGTITVVETTISRSSGVGEFDSGAHEQQETETKKIEIQLRDTESETGSGGSVFAMVTGTASGTFDRLQTYVGWVAQSCGAVSNRRMNNTSRDYSHGTNVGEARINIMLQPDGSYLINAFPQVQVELTGQFSGTIDTFGAGCVVTPKTDGRDHVPSTHSFGDGIQAVGMIDPRTPSVLTGSKTEDLSPPPAGSGNSTYRRTKTTTWSVRRN